jgi:Spy/CpxP family protein refolding chaperone
MKQILTLVVLPLFVASVALSQERPRRPEGAMVGPRLLERLNLNNDQKSQIEKLRAEFQKQQIAQRAKVQTARVELRQVLRAENPDKSAIEKKINEVAQLNAQLQTARVNHLLNVRKVLTPEQQKMIREAVRERVKKGFFQRRLQMMREFGPRFRGRFEGRMGGFGRGMRRPF